MSFWGHHCPGHEDEGFTERNRIFAALLAFFFFFVVLGLEFRAYTLSHSTSPIL
jgi:hypothetical protein